MNAKDMTNKDRLPPMNFSLTRRQLVAGSAAAGLLVAAPVRKALAQARVQITEGNFQPIPIAIPNFVPGTQGDIDVANGIAGVITNNLKRSGLFAPIDQQAFIERISNIDVPPQFQNWRQINAQALVTGRATRQGDGRLKAEFRLWDVPTAKQLTGQQYFT